MQKHNIFLYSSLLTFSIILSGCDIETQSIINPTTFTFAYDFEGDEQGWEGDFANYPVEEEELYELSFMYDTLPENLPQQGALRVSGNNQRDDLVMFLKKEITGLKPNTAYNIVFNVAFASQYPESSPGVDGSPGASVGMLVGAMQEEPEVFQSDIGFGVNAYVTNFDHRIPNSRGAKTDDVLNIGNIGIPGEQFIYTLIIRSNEDIPFTRTSDKDGRLWVIVATESFRGGTTTLFYDEIGVTLTEK